MAPSTAWRPPWGIETALESRKLSSVLHAEPAHLIALYGYIGLYGYWIIALIVGLESIGIPLPGETTLIAAAGFAAAGHAGLSLEGIILAAVAGAVVGDTIGYWTGGRIGFPVLLR